MELAALLLTAGRKLTNGFPQRFFAPQREAIAEELRGHLEERLAALAAKSVEPQEAVSMALAEFGDAAALAAEFSAISRTQKRRWIMRTTIGSVCATLVAVGAIVSVWPESRGDLSATAALAQESQPESVSPATVDEAAKTGQQQRVS